MIDVEDSKRWLMWHGMFLFLLGLLTGLVEAHFTNPRMGLAAHLEGVMNGIFLLALGAIWTEVRLAAGPKAIAYWSTLYGTYVNWAVTTLAAFFGASALSPVTGGRGALPWQETLVTAGFMTVGIAAHCGCVIRAGDRCTDILLRLNSRSRPAATVDFRSGRIALFGSTASAESSADMARTSPP